MTVKENLTSFAELMSLLGYIDNRSIKKWCKKYFIPVIKLGTEKYILSHYLTQIIDNQLVIFAKDKFLYPINYLSENKIEVENSEELKDEGVSEKDNRSKATERFLKRIKGYEKGS